MAASYGLYSSTYPRAQFQESTLFYTLEKLHTIDV